MKKFRFTFIIILLLSVLAAILVMNSRKGTMRQRNNMFAVNDTSNVTKIFIADKQNNTVKLERVSAGDWKVNGKYAASADMVEIMLRTLISLDVKAPVSRNARNNIIRLMAAKSVKVEVYQRVYRINIFNWVKLFPHEKRTKTYYVGDATQDNMGTFMLMEGSENPYVVYIPGFRGFVATRYSSLDADWRDHGIFNSKLPEIKQVSITYSELPQQSFSITNNNNRNFVLTALLDNAPIQDFDTLKVIQFLGSFNRINFESFLDLEKQKYDSIMATPPTFIMSLDDRVGKHFVLKGWHRKAGPGETDLEGNAVKWDRDRMYAQIEGSPDLVSIQYFVFDRILKPLAWFTDKSAN
jgi:hypothetical protein